MRKSPKTRAFLAVFRAARVLLEGGGGVAYERTNRDVVLPRGNSEFHRHRRRDGEHRAAFGIRDTKRIDDGAAPSGITAQGALEFAIRLTTPGWTGPSPRCCSRHTIVGGEAPGVDGSDDRF